MVGQYYIAQHTVDVADFGTCRCLRWMCVAHKGGEKRSFTVVWSTPLGGRAEHMHCDRQHNVGPTIALSLLLICDQFALDINNKIPAYHLLNNNAAVCKQQDRRTEWGCITAISYLPLRRRYPWTAPLRVRDGVGKLPTPSLHYYSAFGPFNLFPNEVRPRRHTLPSTPSTQPISA